MLANIFVDLQQVRKFLSRFDPNETLLFSNLHERGLIYDGHISLSSAKRQAAMW